MKRKEKRTKKFVDRAVQGAVVSRFLLHELLFMLVGSLIVLFIQFLSNPFQGMASLLETFWRNAGPFILVLVAMLPIFIWDTIKLTNRSVGPMCRVRSTLRRINQGEKHIPPIHFREGDFWHDLADDLNVMIKQLNQTEEKKASPAHSQQELEPEEAVV